jgi:hypothetical protein
MDMQTGKLYHLQHDRTGESLVIATPVDDASEKGSL